MSAWWGWPTRFRGAQEPQNRDLTASEPENAPADHREPERLTAPQGTIRWLCVTPAGGKSDHPSEQAALNRAAMSTGSVVYPAVVEIEEEAS